MDDTISRQAAIDALKREEALVRAFGYHNAIDAIRELPSAQRKVLKYTGESICLNCWTRVCDGCLFEPMEGVQ